MFSFMKKQDVFIIRRGSAILGKVSSANLTKLIEARKLFGSDRISKDGKNWSRLDHDPKIRKQLALAS